MRDQARTEGKARWLMALRYAPLPASTLAVASMLATMWTKSMDPKAVTIAALARWANVSRATAGRALEELVAGGWIYRDDSGLGRGNATSYGGRIPAEYDEQLEEQFAKSDRMGRQMPLVAPANPVAIGDVLEDLSSPESVSPMRRFGTESVSSEGLKRLTDETFSEDPHARKRLTHETQALRAGLKGGPRSSERDDPENRLADETFSDPPPAFGHFPSWRPRCKAGTCGHVEVAENVAEGAEA